MLQNHSTSDGFYQTNSNFFSQFRLKALLLVAFQSQTLQFSANYLTKHENSGSLEEQ
jgi:hypothetical protein